MIFALLTVIITVHAYVFYSLYVVNGRTMMSLTGASSVLGAIRQQGGVYMLGRMCPIWFVVILEFILAYCLEIFMGSPLSFKLACRVFDPSKNHPISFESAIICATVGLMCPAMSFIAAFLYYPYYNGFHLLTALADWLKLMCYNLPFAYFTQMFFIQPAVRTLFKVIFQNDLKARAEKARAMAAQGEKLKPEDEYEAIQDILKRIDEIKAELDAERAKATSK